MKAATLSIFATVLICGCASSPESDTSPAPTPTPPVTTTTAAAQPTDQQKQDAAAAEASLHTLGVPIYAGAVVDASQHASADPSATNAVFTTPATMKQVEYFYNSFPELKSQTANGSTVFSGTMNKVPMVIEIRAKDGKTEITAQGRQAD